MKCPKCKKEGAKYSKDYPDLIIYKCCNLTSIESRQREIPSYTSKLSLLDILRELRHQGFSIVANSATPTDYPLNE